LAIALIAVPAILIGLLAMHVLTNGGVTEASTPHASTTHTRDAAPAQSPEHATASTLIPIDNPMSGGCGGECAPNHGMPSHDMLSMICVLALLITLVLLIPQLTLTRWEQLRRALLALIAKAASLAPPSPPSLHVLSISRT
jgi:hypothetical protein